MSSKDSYSEILVIRMPAWLKDKLENLAKSKGLSVSAFARMLLAEEVNKRLKSTKSS